MTVRVLAIDQAEMNEMFTYDATNTSGLLLLVPPSALIKLVGHTILLN